MILCLTYQPPTHPSSQLPCSCARLANLATLHTCDAMTAPPDSCYGARVNATVLMQPARPSPLTVSSPPHRARRREIHGFGDGFILQHFDAERNAVWQAEYMWCSVYMSGDMGRLDACFQQQGQAARYEELNSLQGFISWAR